MSPPAQQEVAGGQLSVWQCLLKLFTFELPLKQPWLEQFGSSRLELARLAANLGDCSHQQATQLMDGLLKMSTLQLVRQRAHCNAKRVRLPLNSLRIGVWEPEAKCRSYARWVGFGSASLGLALVLYSSATIYWAAYLVLQHDIQFTRMRPVVLRHNMSIVTTSGIQCAIKSEIVYGPLFDEARLRQVSERLDQLGQLVRSQLGVSFLALAIIGSTPLIFYCLPMLFVLLHGHRLRLDSIASLYEPLKDWHRLMGDQNDILRGMLHSFKLSRRECDYSLCCCRAYRLQLFQRLTERSIREPQSQEFMETVGELMLERELPRPMVANSEWHLVKQKFVPFIVRLFLAISLGFPTSAMLVANLLELHVRVVDRLHARECSRWHPEAVLLRPTLRLEPISNHHEQLYDAYDGSLRYRVFLMLSVESAYLGDLRAALRFALTMLPVILVLACWSTFWTTIYLLGFLDKIAWLVQIRKQLEWCNRLARHELAAAKSERRRKRHSGAKQLLRKLLCVFVNYELYRRQYKPFRILTNFLLFQAAVFTGAATIVFYLIVINIETQFRLYMLFTSGCVIGFLNIYLLLASYTSKLVEKIQLELIRLLAIVAQDSQLRMAPALDIWRRQLLTESELQLFASTRVLGFTASYKRIIAFNVHIVGVWLIMWRAFGNSALQ